MKQEGLGGLCKPWLGQCALCQLTCPSRALQHFPAAIWGVLATPPAALPQITAQGSLSVPIADGVSLNVGRVDHALGDDGKRKRALLVLERQGAWHAHTMVCHCLASSCEVHSREEEEAFSPPSRPVNFHNQVPSHRFVGVQSYKLHVPLRGPVF